jgi:hypothetical protein
MGATSSIVDLWIIIVGLQATSIVNLVCGPVCAVDPGVGGPKRRGIW